MERMPERNAELVLLSLVVSIAVVVDTIRIVRRVVALCVPVVAISSSAVVDTISKPGWVEATIVVASAVVLSVAIVVVVIVVEVVDIVNVMGSSDDVLCVTTASVPMTGRWNAARSARLSELRLGPGLSTDRHHVAPRPYSCDTCSVVIFPKSATA